MVLVNLNFDCNDYELSIISIRRPKRIQLEVVNNLIYLHTGSLPVF
jgi:hypothetical protein